MFNWVVKVVPHPPGTNGNLGEDEKPSHPSSAQRKKVTFQDEAIKVKSKDSETSEENSAQSGMITWISSGFAYALPQPAGAYRLSNANSEAKEDNIVDRQGIGIIGWIVQGLGKVVPQLDDKYKEGPEPGGDTEIKDDNDVSDAEALPVVEVLSENGGQEAPDSSQSSTPGMVDWIKHGFEKIIPQPEISGTAHCPPVKGTSQPPEAQKPAEEEANMVGWFVKGLGRMVPQPVLKPKENASEETVVQNICICQQTGHLVVEDIQEGLEAEPEKPQDLQEESSEPTQVLSTQQEETEAHTEATTVTVVDSQEQLEAGNGEVKLDSQPEGSIQPEEDAPAKLAEESAQPEEDQAPKLAEEATQASSGEQLANIQEEDMKEDSECLQNTDPVEGAPPLVSTETEPKLSEPTEVEQENASMRDSLAQLVPSADEPEPCVVTKQPDPAQDPHPPSPIAQDEENTDEGCGVPTSCIAVRNWLMQMPHTSECLANFNQLLQSSVIALPKMSCKPSLGLTCQNPCQNLPHVAPQLSQLPRRVQQYYLNVLSGLNSLRPQQET